MRKNQIHKPPSFRTIEAATRGDVAAMNAIVRHYSGYFAVLSMRKFWDECGCVRIVADPEIQRRLETKLITKVFDFKIA